STRERFESHALDLGCIGCHKRMDPIGLGFENFDAAGRWRETENGQPVDASGDIRGWPDGGFAGATGLGRKLADSPRVKACVTRLWFEYASGRATAPADACSLDVLQR